IGTPEAVAMLANALDVTSPTRNDARAKIEVARGLAGHTDIPAARATLLAIVSFGGAAPSTRAGGLPFHQGGDPFGDEAEQAGHLELARRTAAIALAQSGDARLIDALVSIARGGGVGQQAAANALLAFPPATLT